MNAAYRIRIYVFERVLQRDLTFFEGSGAVSGGDIAYRITAEAADVTDTVYALLNVSCCIDLSGYDRFIYSRVQLSTRSM